jgi:hypothetical protein
MVEAIGQSRKAGRSTKVTTKAEKTVEERQEELAALYVNPEEEDVKAILAQLSGAQAECYLALVACGLTRLADAKAPWVQFYEVGRATGIEKPTGILRELVTLGVVKASRRFPSYIANVFFKGELTAQPRKAKVDSRVSAIMRSLRPASGE